MITGRTNTIGVVGADIANPFFASAMRGIGDVARRDGFGTILTNSDEDVALEREAVGLLLQKQVDGIIVSPASSVETGHLADAARNGTPVVLFDRDVAELTADAVLTDSVGASRMAVGHLLDLGHRRIAIVAELRAARDMEWPNWIDSATVPDVRMLMPSGARLLGYIQAHEAAGVPVDPALIRGTGSYDPVTAREQTLEALRLDPPPTAIFTVDNVMTHGAYQACRDMSIRIPEDLSFVAYDDMEWMTFVEPNITALWQPVYDMGTVAAEMLIRRLRSPEVEPVRRLLGTKLIVRGSTMAPR